jgi:class 3 adenylate cyclase/tetratricopeptide (TPR) repeat protein
MGRVDLPEGPVTLMFTDIEGSTALRTTLGDADADALFAEHDEIVRAQIDANNGQDQKAALGDGFLAVFVSTRRAVACAIAIQRALDSFNLRRSGPPLRVRVGLNTGEVAWQGDLVSGEAVHAAARVCAAASGGQILVSDVTRQLAGTIADVSFRDTGEHELKGFPEPWRLWDVVWVRETTPAPRQVFVGRDAELATLRTRLLGALEGNGGLVLVGGEPGVGKTTLVRQLIREAEQRGALAVFGRCYESEGAVPYAPFVEMLEQALAIMPPDLVREDLGDDAPEVARMVPELHRRFPDIGDPLDLPPEQQRRYFFNALAAFITRGSKRFPLLLVIDDVHWADEPSLLLIEHMAAVLPELRVLGIGTYRDVELLVRGRLVDRLAVKRFDRDDVGRMLEALAGKPAPVAVVQAVFDETEGNAFFVEEVFWHLVEERKLFDEDGNFRTDLEVDELDVPESVRLVVGRRLERLGPEAQRVLAAGAVVGRAFPFTLLEAITPDVDAWQLLDIVEEAEAGKIVVPEEHDGQIYYSFAHELIRQTLLASLSLLRRQRLHLAIADAIERTDRRAAETRPSEVAHHLLQAGAGADPERTLTYLERTAERALASAAFEDALRAVDDALALADRDDTLRRAQLLEQRGWALRAVGRLGECLEIWEQVLDVYEEHGEVERAAELCYEIAYQYVWLDRMPEAVAVDARGVELLGDRRNATRVVLVAGAASVMGLAGFVDEADEQFAGALELARELGDDRTTGRLEWGRTLSNWSNSRIAEAVESGRASVEYLRRSQDAWTLVDALGWASFPLLFTGSLSEGRAFAQEAVALGEKLGHVAARILAERGVAMSGLVVADDVATFEREARADVERLGSIRSPWVSQSHAMLANALLLRGDLEGSAREAEQAIRLEPASAFTGIGWAHTFLARAFGGDRAGCRDMLADARGVLPAPSGNATTGRTIMLYAAVHGGALAGLDDEAGGLYEAVAARIRGMPVSAFDLTLGERAAGMAAALAGLWDRAEEHFVAAARLAEANPVRIEQPQVRYWHAWTLLRRGDPADRVRAGALLKVAHDDFAAIGMPLHTALAETLLRDLD